MIGKKILLFLFLCCLLYGTGCQQANPHKDTTNTNERKNLVKFVFPRKGTIESVLSYSGQLEPVRQIDLAPELAMELTALLVEIGDIVEKNDLLAIMDTTQLAQAKIQYTDAQSTYYRLKNLLPRKAIDQQTVDHSAARYKTAKSFMEQVQKNTYIRAPFSGIVTNIYKEAGEIFSPMIPNESGTISLIRIINLDTLKVVLSISDKDISTLHKHDLAYLQVDTYPHKKFCGYVHYLSSEANIRNSNFDCHVYFPNKMHLLKSHQYAKIELVTAQESGLIVPQNAIIDSTYLYIIQNNIAYRKKVILGIGNNEEILVVDGMKPMDKVIIEGNLGLPNKTPVYTAE